MYAFVAVVTVVFLEKKIRNMMRITVQSLWFKDRFYANKYLIIKNSHSSLFGDFDVDCN